METFFGNPGSAPALVSIALFTAIALIAVGCTVAVQWRKARQAESQAVLKQEMIKRGMSADDIVRVIQAGSAETLVVENRAQMYERLVGEGWEHEDIMRVIQLRDDEQANAPERAVNG